MASRVDLIVVVIYLILMVAIGIAVSYFNKDDSDFFRGGNKMPWWLAGISLFMSTFSVYTFTGAAGLAYRSPGIAFTLYFTNAIGYLIGFLFLASRWRRSRSTTVFSYLTERYGLATNQIYSWVGIAAGIVQGGVMLLALGKFVSVAIGTDLASTIIVCGFVIAIYCLIGGLWAVAITDTLQFMVIFPTAIVTTFLAIKNIGGMDALFADISTNWHIPDSGVDMTGNSWSFAWSFICAYAVMMIFASSSGVAAQRYFSVKNEKEAKKVAIMTSVLLLLAPLVWLLPPVCTRILDLDITYVSKVLGMKAPEESAYVVFCLRYLPVGAMGIVLAAMLSATMSSLSSFFNAFAAVFTDDIIKQLFWKNAGSKALLLVGRIVTLVIGALVVATAIVMSRSPGGVFQLMLDFSGIVIVPAGIPIVMGLFYKRTPWWTGIASYLFGLSIGVLAKLIELNITLFGIPLLSSPVTFEQQIFTVGTLSAIIYFLPGAFIALKGRFKEKLDAFFAKIDTPVAASEVGDSELTDAGSYRITGWTTVFMGCAVAVLALLDLPFADRMINLSVGGLMTLSGLTLIYLCSIARKKKQAALEAQK